MERKTTAIVFESDSMEELLKVKEKLEAAGIQVFQREGKINSLGIMVDRTLYHLEVDFSAEAKAFEIIDAYLDTAE